MPIRKPILALLAAGGTIMIVGSTSVFVPQDLKFMGLSAAQLHAINPHAEAIPSPAASPPSSSSARGRSRARAASPRRSQPSR